METSFQELKKKEVVNVLDGKHLGKVCNVTFTFPEGRVLGFVVPGGKGFHWGKDEIFIGLKQIKKIGIDVILVEVGCAPPPERKKEKGDCAPPPNCPPPCPPPRPRNQSQFYDRRDYGDYE